MGHDVHFLERLDRLEQEHLGLAVALYQNSAVVKIVLGEAPLPAEGRRAAIALDDGPDAPHIVVERASGHFVTCLAAGMRHDLPVISRAALERAAAIHADVKDILAAGRAMNACDELVSRFHALYAGPRLSREAFRDLFAWGPALARDLALEQVKIIRRYAAAWAALRDKERLRERDLPTARVLWRQVTLMQNQMFSIARGARRPLKRAVAADGADAPDYIWLQYVSAGRLTRLVSAVARGLGATLLIDVEDVLETAVRAYLHPTGGRYGDGAFVLALLGLRVPGLAAEAARLLADLPVGLAAPDDEDLALYARLRDVLARPDEARVRHEERARAYLAATIGDLSGVPATDVLAASASRPAVLAELDDHLALVDMLPYLARAEPEELFVPADLLARFPPENVDEDALAYADTRRRMYQKQRSQDAPTPAPPGRNDPCHCGSGRKFKKCHGANG